MDYGRGFRSLLPTAILVVLLGLVAFSSRSGFDSSGQPAVSNTYVSYAMSVFLVFFVAMIPVAIYSYFLRTKEIGPEARAPKKRIWRIVAAICIFGLIVYLRRYFSLHGGLFHSHFFLHHPQAPPGPQHLKGGKGGVHHQQQPHFEYSVLWIALALGAVALVAGYVAYKRRPQLPEEPARTMEDEVVATIDDAIDDLENEPDPRRAVIAAYARMERTFGQHGLARRPSETAIEYLRRVLHEMTARSGAVERLTSLFERAKFSRHDITEPMKQDAISSLREIRESIA
jgi:hypothetical protein